MATYGQEIQIGPFFSGGLLCLLKVYHYASGTTNLLNVYTDREKTTTALQPAVSDANGIVSFFADGLYKFRIDVATNGVTYSTLYTYDKWAVVDQSSTLSGKGVAIASASTLTLGTDGDFFHVTGTVTTTAISGSQNAVTLVADAAWPLTYSGNLLLLGGVNRTLEIGSVITLINESAGVWREVGQSTTHNPLYDTKGDLLVATAADTPAKLVVGTNGAILMARSAATTGLAYVYPFDKYITRLGWINDVTDPTNDIDINPGGCMDATGVYWMQITSSLVKQSDVIWAVGGTPATPAGALDTGAVGNNDYYIWLIARSDTGVVDALYSLSSTAPTMPANYDFKRLVGWFKRVGGTIVAFTTYETEGGGIELLWTVPTLDVNLANTLTTARRTDAMKVPLNVSTTAIINVNLTDAAAAYYYAWIGCPDQADAAPSLTAAPLANYFGDSINSDFGAQMMRIRTSAAGLVAARASVATIDLYAVVTLGFIWARRT